MKGLNILVILFLTAALPFTGAPVSGQPVPRSGSELTLRKFLYEVGNKYDCYFTIELALQSGDQRQSLEGRSVSGLLNTTSLQKELDRLQKTIPYLQYSFDPYNARIIHIIDARLRGELNYPMDKIIRRVNFDGIGFDLINTLGKKGVAVSSKGPFDVSEGLSIDLRTHLHVRESNKSVRNILTNSLPLQERGRVLWIAQREMGAGQMTFVRFLL